ncbi:carbohydrate ABC transporter permease [Rhodococcus sp. NCIMB 12038]|uniref:carbohydrate ABC transporter permease n=1 Tax=Rhodococcus sp. NCIMB 12038 TaxID=933800 RepID=UPI001179C052|nr:carbohydrate ABC transporter permease [Rhodococcus sp. NCIMB 12038]
MFTLEIALLIFAAAFCIPLYLVVTTSLKSTDEMLRNPFGLPSEPTTDAFATAWAEGGQSGLGSAVFASVTITTGTVVALVAIGSLAAYVLGRRTEKLSTALYLLFLLGFIIPPQLAILPLYSVFNSAGLVGSLFGMTLLQTGFLMPIAVILYTGFVRVLPVEYDEAARIDGAGPLRTFWSVIFPLLGPVTGTVAVLSAMLVWNDFFAPLIFLSGSKNETVPVAMYSFVGEFSSQWNNVFAAAILSVAPVLLFYIFAQRQLMRGFSGGIKG